MTDKILYNFGLRIILALTTILCFLFLALWLSPALKPKTESIVVYTPPSTDQILPPQVLLNVPFTSQAPFGNWNDPRQDSGCEEASILMAMLWVKGQESITPEEAEKEIIALSEFEQKNYGFFHDTSTQDTLMVLKNYFGYKKAFAVFDIEKKDIKAELARGNLVIVPIDGTIVDNIYYTPPGPSRHKIVIVGYDDVAGVFITNDPGTKNGRGYRYNYQVLENSLMDYLTGFNEPVNEIRKSMIVVQK